MAETTYSSLSWSLADLSLFPATYEQIIESRKRTAVQWSGNMTLEQYLQRDAILDKQEHAADGRFVTWVLAPRSNPATLDFMCSCETFRRTALVARHHAGATASEVQEVTAYGVASVFTPTRNRKKGYARHMMRLLHWVLAPRSALPPTFPKEWGMPPDETMLQSAGVANAQFSVLYSDIGSEFYRSSGLDASSHNGWYVTGLTETSWTFDAEATPCSPSRSDATTPNRNVKHLTQDEVTALYNYDADWIRDDLSRPSATGFEASQAPGATCFTFLPHKGVGGFNISRTVQFGPDLQPSMPLSRWGVVLLPQSVSTLADALATFRPGLEAKTPKALPFISWTFDAGRKEKTLVVTRLRADEEDFPVLLEEMKAVAREENVVKIAFWYMHPSLRRIAEAKSWKTADRGDHLSSVKWYGDEGEEDLEWVNNEKFCWC